MDLKLPTGFNIKRYFAAIIICVFAILPHFLFLGSIPTGMSNDEIEYALSSKTYTLNGADLSGSTFPSSLFVTGTSGSISAVPPILLSPLWKVFPLNQQSVRLVYVIINLLTAVALGYLVYEIFKKNNLALLSSFIFVLNPWSFFLSRFAAEGVFVLLFFTIGIGLLIRLQGLKLILPFLFLIVGFFSYHGAKIIFLPVIIICLVYKLILNKQVSFKKLSPELVFAIFTLIFLFAFGIISKSFSTSIVNDRLNEVVFFNKEMLNKNVNLFRNQEINSPVNFIFVNKITESLRIFAYNYFYALSPLALFLTGDPRVIYSFYYHGLFYLFDLPFIILGSIFLWKNNRKVAAFISALILIAPVPTAISTSGQSVVNRSFMLLPLLLAIISYGIYTIYQHLGKKLYQTIFSSALIILMIFSYFNFLYLYFFRLPVLAQENYATSQRVLAKYINTAEFGRGQKIVAIGQQPRDNYLHTIFYSSNEIQEEALRNKPVSSVSHSYEIKNVLFTRDCPIKFSKENTYIIESAYKCDAFKKVKTSYHIVDQKDAGPILDIYNSTVCKGVALTSWNSVHKFSDYSIESMNKNNFCQRWISI